MVEQRVYAGIAKDHTDFTDIVGNAQPVLGNIEKAIEQLALTNAHDRYARADEAIAGIRTTDIAELAFQRDQGTLPPAFQ